MVDTKIRRDFTGKPAEFTRYGRHLDIARYLKRKGMSEYDLIDVDVELADPLFSLAIARLLRN